MKKALTLMAIVACSLNFGTGKAEATKTEDLQKALANGNVYIQYVNMVTEKSAGFNLPIVKSSVAWPIFGKKKVEESIPQATQRLLPGHKFIYAVKDGKHYYQHDYATMVSERGNQYTYAYTKYTTQADSKYGCDYSWLNFDESGEFVYVVGKQANTRKYINNDVNLVIDGKVYALNRTGKNGVWKDFINIDPMLNAKYLLSAEMIVPNAITALLLPNDKYKKTYLGTEQGEIDAKTLDCEKYLVEEFEDGITTNKKYMFSLYYDGADLKYFTGLRKESTNNDSLNVYPFFEQYPYSDKVRKVEVLEHNVPENLFNILSEYTLIEASDK